MGIRSSSLLSRRKSLCLCLWLCPSRAKARQHRDADDARGRGAPLGVVVMPLENPPDVIGAHERHYSSAEMPARQSQLRPAPTLASARTAAEANSSQRSRFAAHHPEDTVTLRASKPWADYRCGGGIVRGAAPGEATSPITGAVSVPADRTLPTQHQHPTPRSPGGGGGGRAKSAADWQRAPDGHGRGHGRAPHRPRPQARAPRTTCAPTRGRHHGRHHGHASRARKPSRCARRGSASASRTCFGYDIQDVDGFLDQASLESPANIPMVLSSACTLYRTKEGGWQEEVPLPLGMVVNGVFRVEACASAAAPASCWLYAQTPHGHEGYVRYGACLPLGILAASKACPAASAASSASTSSREETAPAARAPCWDTASDIFPFTAPSSLASLARSHRAVAEDTRSERMYGRPGRRARPRHGLGHETDAETRSAEQSVDDLYLRSLRPAPAPRLAAPRIACPSRPQPLVVVQRPCAGLASGDVVAVLARGGGLGQDGWLLVQRRDGSQAVVPTSIAESAFL